MNITKYRNPVLRGMYPDPSIVRINDTFYMVNSTFEYYPGIALSKSTDLLNWTKLPGIISSPKQADLRTAKSNEGIFAACIRYHLGYFYVITTNFAEFKNFIIRGKLSDDHEAIIWENKRIEVDIMGIDPDLFFENNRTYVQFTGYIDDKGTKAIQQVEIELETGTILRGPEVIGFGSGGRDVEGPHILKEKGYYYLLTAEGGTGLGHMITMFRSRSLWGPFEDAAPDNPLFTNRDRAEEPLQNIGHADLFQDAFGNWWLTCLGTRPAKVGFTNFTNIGRETLLYPVDWSKDWPIINNGIPSEKVDLSQFSKHTKTLTSQKYEPFIDTFSKPTLNPEWISLRNSLDDKAKIINRQLHLKGSATTFSDLSTPSFLGIRQTEHEEEFTVLIDKKTQLNSGAIGIVTIINADHYGALLIEKENNSFTIFKQLTILDINIKEKIGTFNELPSQLKLVNTKDKKIFSAQTDSEVIKFSVNAMHFSNEAIAALNTGDIQGIYALDDSELIVSKVIRKIK